MINQVGVAKEKNEPISLFDVIGLHAGADACASCQLTAETEYSHCTVLT